MVSSNSYAQKGIEFFKGTFEEALQEAKTQKKSIFLDAYAEWCGPCKQMAATVFTNEAVGEYYNKHFINLKIDMEKGEGPALSKKFAITAYPTLIYLDFDGKVLQNVRGAKNVEQFMNLAKTVLIGNAPNLNALEEEYEKGNREAAFLKSYAYALLLQNKPSTKIANEYLRTQSDMTTADNLAFLFDYCLEADSRIFNLVIENALTIKSAQGQNNYKRQIEKACNNTVKKAVEFNAPNLLKEAKNQMKKALPEFAKEYELLADIQYYQNKQDTDNLMKSIEAYLKKYAAKNAEKYYQYTVFAIQNIQDKSALLKAEKWAKTAIDLDLKAEYLKAYIYLLQVNGSNEKELQKRQSQLQELSQPKAN